MQAPFERQMCSFWPEEYLYLFVCLYIFTVDVQKSGDFNIKLISWISFKELKDLVNEWWYWSEREFLVGILYVGGGKDIKGT